jgi:hypothetical protein
MVRTKRQLLRSFTKRQLAFYERAIERQSVIVAELEKAGHQETEAHRLLLGWREMYVLLREENDRWQKKAVEGE